MRSGGGRRAGGADVWEDMFALMVVGLVFGGPLLVALLGSGPAVVRWLAGRGVVVCGDPVVFGLSGGCGLDWGRALIVVGVVLAMVAWAWGVVRRRRMAASVRAQGV